MIAIEIREPGGPEVLTPVERPRPAAGDGEVLIRVAAAGVNRPDVLQRLGRYPPPPGASDIPGLEVAGTIDAVGAGGAATGASATRCARSWPAAATPSIAPRRRRSVCPCRAGSTSSTPRRFPKRSSPCGPTCSSAAGSQPARSILVHGGSSGIGTTAIQLARALGARVFATAGTAEKCAACERLGAERAINYRETDFVAAVKEPTGGRGVDVVLDMVGGDYLQRNIDVARDGRPAGARSATLGGVKSPDQYRSRPAAAADDHRIDAAARVRWRRRARSRRPCTSTCGRSSNRAPSADRPSHVSASRRRRGAPGDGSRAPTSASWCFSYESDKRA